MSEGTPEKGKPHVLEVENLLRAQLADPRKFWEVELLNPKP